MPRRCQLGIKSCKTYIANRNFCHPPFDHRILLTHEKSLFHVGFFWFIIRREALLRLSFRARSLSDWPRGNRKAKGWICVGHDFKKKISPSTYREIATGTVRGKFRRFDTKRVPIFSPRAPPLVTTTARQSGGSVHREAHSRRHLTPSSTFAESHTSRRILQSCALLEARIPSLRVRRSDGGYRDGRS